VAVPSAESTRQLARRLPGGRSIRRGLLIPASAASAAAALLVLAGVGVASGQPASGRLGAAPAATGFGSNWPTYHENPLSSGVDPAGTNLRPLREAWVSRVLDGQLYGEPLVEGGRVVVATETDTVYELAARSGGILWSRHLATPVPSGDLPCGDISPTVGITSTPVIDPARNEIFVVADEHVGSSGAAHHLFGLDLYTGDVELNEVVDPPGSTPTAQLQRPALALSDGQVIIGFGGNDGDCASYHGWIVAVPEAGGPHRTYEVDSAPGESQGAVWMGGASPVVDSAGNIWFATGNGSVSSSSGPYDHSDSVTELSPTLKLEQIFAPSTWYSDNGSDFDLGSASPALVDGLVFQVGKRHVAYLLEAKHLGGIGGQVAEMPLCGADPDGGLAVDGSTVYVPCGNGLTAVAIRASPPSMRVLWTTSTGSSGPAILSSGLVWTIDQGGTLWGLNPQTGNAVVSKSLNGVATHFPSPSVADGLLLAPATDQIYAYEGPAGLPPPPTAVPGAKRYWVAAANGAVFPFGGAPSYGSLAGVHLTKPVVGIASTAGGRGYWLVASDGGVFAFGNAHFHGSMGGRHLNRPIVGIAATPDGEGYWLVASDGGIFAFGDARFRGSMGGRHLNRPIVGMAAQPGGDGYWLVASDGGIFAFGGARFDGSTGAIHLDAPISGMAPNPVSGGYWLVGTDGGIFAFGAPYRGSLGGTPTPSPVVCIAATPDGGGYWIVDRAGDVSGFGDAIPEGSPAPSAVPIVAVNATG